jgi:restriction endonuclease S subunit
MAQISIIEKSQLEGAMRLDAEYYQSAYMQRARHIKDIGYSEIDEIGKIAYGTTPTGGVFEENGIPFIRSQNFTLLSIDTPSLPYCTYEFHSRNLKSVVKPGDVLLAAVGATIGQVAIAPDDLGEANINQNIARVHIISNDFLPTYVAVFLSTYWGQFQIKRLVTGNAQQYLNSHQIGQLRIPKLPLEKQAEPGYLLQQVREKLKHSESLYLQAEQLLMDKVGLKNVDLSNQLYHTVPFKKTMEVNRLDAEHFRPKYDVIMNSTGWGTIGRANCIMHQEKTVVDNHVTIIRCDEGQCNPVYMAVFLNSKMGQMQTEKWLSGSSGQIEIYPADIGRYVVYLPSMEFQQKIADLVTRSWETLQKARKLLEEAKHKVENIIEDKTS